MVCRKCGVRMRVMESANNHDRMQTARRYKCPECWNKLYTIEVPYDEKKVKYVMRNYKWSDSARKRNGVTA